MIIITGGAGFIGSNLAKALEEKPDKKVVICDRLKGTEKWKNISKRSLYDILPPEDLFSFLDKNAGSISVIFHLGGLTSSQTQDPSKFLHDNIRFSLDLFHWCGRNRARFIYASSASTYGEGAEGFDDTFTVDALSRLRPTSALGWSKNTFDKAVALTYERFSKEVPTPPQCVGLKFFSVYGPNEYHKEGYNSGVPDFVRQVIQKGEIILFQSHREGVPHGHQTKDFVYIKDCVDVMMWFLDNPHKSGLYNVGTGKGRRFDELTNVISSALGKDHKISFIEMPAMLQKHYQYYTQASLHNLRSIGYTNPFLSLEEGVKDYIHSHLLSSDPYV